MKKLSQYFINGIILIVPIAITIFLIDYIFTFTESLIGHFLPVNAPGLSLAVLLVVVVLIGWLSSLWLLKNVIYYGEKLINTIPIVKFIYNNVKQFSKAVFESQNLLKHAVLVPYPHEGAKALGFLVESLSPPLSSKFSEPHVCVFIPMSLNLTSGINIIFPEREIIPLDISSESALQYVVTAGVVMPQAHDASIRRDAL